MRILMLASLLLSLPLWAGADVVQLANGDRVSGRLVAVDGTSVVVDSSWGGILRIDREAVRSIESEAPLGVELDDGREADYRLVESDSGEQALEDASGELSEVGIGAVALVYRDAPPRRIVDDFRLDATYGLNITSGNADTQTHSIRGNLGFRRGEQRHSTRLEVDRKIDEGDVTKSQYRLGYQLDWFFAEDWYAYGTSEYFSDTIKDVDLRFTFGAGAGHQFWDHSLSALSAEAGTSIVVEEIAGDRTENPAVRLALKYNRFFLGKTLELYHQDEILVLTDFDRGQLLNTSTGLRFILTDQWKAEARMDLVYETEPVPGNEKADITYIVGVGYSF